MSLENGVIHTSWSNAIVGALGVGILLATYYAGWQNGASRKEVKYVRAEASMLREWTQTVTTLGQAFTALAEASTRERVEIRYKTKTITNEVVKYVEQMPEDQLACYELPEPVFALRLCAIDQLYTAARAELPPERVGATCPAPLP